MMNKRRLLIFLLIGITAFGFPKDNNIPIIKNINIIGATSIPIGDIQAVLKMKEPVLLSKMTFDRRNLKLDAISVKTLFISKGFLSVTVKDSFKINDDKADVFIIINEGKQSHVKAGIVTGNAVIDDQNVLKVLGIKLGKEYNPVGINTNRSLLEETYYELGYLFSKFAITDSISDSVTVTVKINEGHRVRINNISWTGLEGLNSEFVNRELAFKTGDIYKKSAMDLSQQRLLRTGIFSGANFIPLAVQGTDSLVNIIVELRHIKLYEWISEGGYYPINFNEGLDPPLGVGADIEWRSRRIFNTGISFAVNLSAELGWIEDIIHPIIRSEVNLSNQWLFGFRIPTELELYFELLKDYRPPENPYVQRSGVKLSNTFEFTERSFIQMSFRWEKFSGLDDVSNTLKRNIQQRSLNFSLFLDHTDHPLYPTNGLIYTILANRTGGLLGGERHFYKLDLGIRGFKSVGSSVLAGRVKAGRVFGWSEQEFDVNWDLFYLGGSTSLRGWDYGRFHETDNTNLPKGDIIRVLINAELRFPLIWNFGGEIFVDGGYLTSNVGEEELTPDAIEWDAGIGITLKTPLGPVRLDLAAPIEKIKSDFWKGDTWKPQLGIHYIF